MVFLPFFSVPFLVQEALDLLGMLHLLAVVLQLLLGDGLADLRGAQLLEDLGDLAGGQVALEGPVLLAAAVRADLGGVDSLHKLRCISTCLVETRRKIHRGGEIGPAESN